MLKAVIFDMDGVLVDSEPLHARAAVLALKNLGVDISIEYFYGFIGSTTIHMLETLIQDYNLSSTVSEILILYNEAKHQLIQVEGYEAVPYTKELIIDLYKHGVKLAIASSSTSTEIEDVVKALGIGSYFDKLISGTTVKHPKPAPDVFLKAVTELGINKSECIIFEDSCNGVRAAKAAGIPVIGFVNEHSGKQDLSKAFVLVEGFDEIDYKFVENTFLRASGQPITIAITNRLIIKELTIDDIVNMYQIYQNPEINKYIDDINDNLEIEIEKHKAYIEHVYNFYGYGFWGVFIKESGELIGRCGIQNNEIDGNNEIEIGYLLDVNYWGNGYAVESAKAILTYAFHELQINRIVAVIDTLNTNSIKVAEHIGMQREHDLIKNGHRCFLFSIEK